MNDIDNLEIDNHDISDHNISDHYIPGIFFVLPCIEAYQKVDLRTITLGVPPQEVQDLICSSNIILVDFSTTTKLQKLLKISPSCIDIRC